MDFTGERFIPESGGDIALEHFQRYLFAQSLISGKDVLDIASGEGYGSDLLARDARSVVGVDISQEAVRHARERYQRDGLRFEEGSCAAIPLEDDSIDVVVSFETLEHHNQHDEMMSEIRRVLRPGGVLVISSPDKREYSDLPGHHNEFHVKELYADEFAALLSRHFARHVMYGQRVQYASLLVAKDSRTTETIERSAAGTDRFDGLHRPVYLVAVASDEVLPELSNSVMVDIENEVAEWQLRELRRVLALTEENLARAQQRFDEDQILIEQLRSERNQKQPSGSASFTKRLRGLGRRFRSS